MAASTPQEARAVRPSQWLGRQFARALKYLLRQEIRFTHWAARSGAPSVLGKAILWTVKISLLVIVGYVSFWIALVLLFVMLAAWSLSRALLPTPRPAPEWRAGPMGVGLYDEFDQRIDPHDPDDED